MAHFNSKVSQIIFIVVVSTAMLLLLFATVNIQPPLGYSAVMALESYPQPKSISAGPDLTVQSLTIQPPNPAPGQSVTVTVVIKNIGSQTASNGFYTHLYIDPSQNPPTTTTPSTTYMGWFLGLNPGATFSWSYTDYEFSTAGCNHTVYAWVDRNNTVTEDDENNNLLNVNLCVGSGAVDSYEPDNTCEQAAAIATDGVSQSHNFYPAGDEDWYSFYGVGGREYVIRASNLGDGTDLRLSLLNRCAEVPPSFGSGEEIRVTLPVSGTYYIRAINENSSTVSTTYTLSVNAGFDCSGYFEPNDSRETARSLPTDGNTQRHTFCAPNDEDWVKFDVVGGITYTVEAVVVGTAVDPVLQGFDPATETYSSITNSLQFGASVSGIYYVRATNVLTEVYGTNTEYDLRVTTQTCTGDDYEPDNNRESAQTVQINGPEQVRNTCPAGERDWAKFTATAGITYTLETVNIGSKSDTSICLFDNLGTQIRCANEDGFRSGARITWQATASGDYYVEIQQASAQAAGTETTYHFGVITGLCRPDLYELDDTPDTGRLLVPDGSRQPRNFCSTDDHDWARLTIPNAGIYTIQTSALGPGSDTVLGLYDTDKTTSLDESDDYGPGLASQIVYTFTQSGTYYVESRHFNPARYGRSTGYQLSAFAGTPSPTPTPGGASPTPTPTATATPPPSGVQTLIVTNRQGMAAQYGEARTDALFEELVQFADSPYVQGEILEVEGSTTVATAYSDWMAHLTNVNLANETAAAIRNLVVQYLDSHPSVHYIVLVGDDRVIPARRISDRTYFPESEYTTIISTTSVGAALAQDYFLSDDYYADQEPHTWDGAELYIPDWPIGRLIETPEQIIDTLETFVESPEMPASKTLVLGYDFVDDVASNICDLYAQDLGTANLDCTMIGQSWTSDQFRQAQLNASPPFKIQSINGHASHVSQGAAVGNSITAQQVLASATDLRGALIYSIGCHSGLNVPENSNLPLDLAEAFANKQAHYLGNTGFGWGSRIEVRFSERLTQIYTQELLKGATTTIGQALRDAKQRYYQESFDFEERDEKILQQWTLYGLPMYRVNTGAVLSDDDPFPGVTITSTFSTGNKYVTHSPIPKQLPANQQTGYGSLNITVPDFQESPNTLSQNSGFTQHLTEWGSYFQLDGHVSTRADTPVQPQFYVHLAPPADQRLSGVIFTGGTYYTTTIDPVIDVGINEFVTSTQEPTFNTAGFYPPIPFSLQNNNDTGESESALTAIMGQYESTTGIQRIYDELQYDVYFSTLTGGSEPTVASIEGYYNIRSDQATFKVEVNDTLPIQRVLIAYTEGNGTWASQDLNYDEATHKWSGRVPGIRGATYYVQAVNSAGNATAVSRNGGYFELTEVELLTEEWTVYLPLIKR